MYARIVNRQIDQVVDQLPTSWTLKDGRTVSSFDVLDNEERLERGEDWRPVVDDIPDFDPETEELGAGSYTVEASRVTRTFAVVARPTPPPAPDPVPSTAERIAALEALAEQLCEATGVPLDLAGPTPSEP